MSPKQNLDTKNILADSPSPTSFTSNSNSQLLRNNNTNNQTNSQQQESMSSQNSLDNASATNESSSSSLAAYDNTQFVSNCSTTAPLATNAATLGTSTHKTKRALHHKLECSSPNEPSSTNSTSNKARCCSINVPLIPIKFILFTWYAAGSCLLPYMTLHMKSLGLNAFEQTAVYTILPIIQLIGTPFAGYLADRLGNYKPVLSITLQLCIATTLLLQFIVPARKPKTSPVPEEDTNDADESGQKFLFALTFWMYLIIRVFHQVTVGLTYVLLDATTIVMAEENNSNYGRQRLWGIFATGIFSPIVGYVIDLIAVTSGKPRNYDPAFYFFEILTLMTLMAVTTLKIKIVAPPSNVWGSIRPLLKSANVWIFLFSVFIMGSCWGFLESFLFIFLQELNAPSFLMGLTVTIGAFVGLPFLYQADWFAKKFGSVHILILALFVYFVRLWGYSYIDNPWWCVPYELMEAFTLHLMWVSTVRLATTIAPVGMLATLQAIVGGLNFAVGRGFGSFVGGTTLAIYGTRVAFRTMGTIALATGIMWAILHKWCLPDLEKFSSHKCPSSSPNFKKSRDGSYRRRQTSKDVEANRPNDTEVAA